MSGKMKTVYGLYKKLGRDAFLDAATNYTEEVPDTIEATIAQLETRWHDEQNVLTEADKMVQDYNDGQLCQQPARCSGMGPLM